MEREGSQTLPGRRRRRGPLRPGSPGPAPRARRLVEGAVRRRAQLDPQAQGREAAQHLGPWLAPPLDLLDRRLDVLEGTEEPAALLGRALAQRHLDVAAGDGTSRAARMDQT